MPIVYSVIAAVEGVILCSHDAGASGEIKAIADQIFRRMPSDVEGRKTYSIHG